MKAQKIPVVLTRGELQKLIDVPLQDSHTQKPHSRYLAVRNEAIIRLMFSTGLRVQEVCNLTLGSVFLDEMQLKVSNGKMGNEEYQPIENLETLESLERYLKEREKLAYKGQWFFLSWAGHRMLARQIGRDLKKYAERAGINKNVYPHILRHTFATEYYRATKDLLATQHAMRHRSPDSTVIYTKIVKDDVRAGLRKANL